MKKKGLSKNYPPFVYPRAVNKTIHRGKEFFKNHLQPRLLTERGKWKTKFHGGIEWPRCGTLAIKEYN